MLKGGNGEMERRKNGVNKVLNVPIHMGSMASNVDGDFDQMKSIWVTSRDDNMVINIDLPEL